MPNFIGLLSQSSDLIIYVFIAVAVMLAVEGLGLFLARTHSYRRHINRRLQLLEEANDRRTALIELRRDRGLSDEGHYTVPFISISRLVLQSGVGWRSGRMVTIVFVAFTVAALGAYVVAQSMVLALLLGILAGTVSPFCPCLSCGAVGKQSLPLSYLTRSTSSCAVSGPATRSQ